MEERAPPLARRVTAERLGHVWLQLVPVHICPRRSRHRGKVCFPLEMESRILRCDHLEWAWVPQTTWRDPWRRLARLHVVERACAKLTDLKQGNAA